MAFIARITTDEVACDHHSFATLHEATKWVEDVCQVGFWMEDYHGYIPNTTRPLFIPRHKIRYVEIIEINP